jgi:predicted  nucleic acid-binding Zn-ribbon protein
MKLVVPCGLLIMSGCDLGLEQSANRFEQLNLEIKNLLGILNQITTEDSARAHQAELEDVAEKIRDIQGGIQAAEEKSAKEGKSMGRIANNRQAQLFEQSGDAARRQVDRIRQADAAAGAVVDKALEGVVFPEPMDAPPIAL